MTGANTNQTASTVSSTRAVLSVFEKYQKERLLFVQTVADLASRETNIEALQTAGVMSLLRALLLDNVPAIQLAAALALGRLANYNEELAEAVVESDILPQLVFSLSEQNVTCFPHGSDFTKRLPRLSCALWPSTRLIWPNLWSNRVL
jgi:hypothetical protein